MGKISVKGVVIGAVVDIVVTFLMSMPLFGYVIVGHGIGTIAREQIIGTLIATMQSDPVFLFSRLLVGSFGSILGGYVAARIAKHDEVFNGALASFLSVGSGLYLLFLATTPPPLWRIVVGIIGTPILSALGGDIRLRTMQRREDGPPQA